MPGFQKYSISSPRAYKHLACLTIVFCLLVTACQTPLPTPTLPATRTPIPPTKSPNTNKLPKTPSPASPQESTSISPKSPDQSQDLYPLVVDPADSFSQVEYHTWQPAPYAGFRYHLPVPLSQTWNESVTSGLTNAQRFFLSQNGFVIVHSQEAQFSVIRQRVAQAFGQPYFLTTDAAYHALNLSSQALLEALEKEELRPRVLALLQATLQEVLAYLPFVKATPIEIDTKLAAAYLAVGLKLIDPQASLDPLLETAVSDQVKQILSGKGMEQSVLIPGYLDNFSNYQPTGHYLKDPIMQAYFRSLTWLQRANFKLQGDDPGFAPTRAPLIITLALRRAITAHGNAADEWRQVSEVLAFLTGTKHETGPVDYAAAMDQIYGRSATVTDLADETQWQAFLQRIKETSPSQTDGSLGSVLYTPEASRGWRFIGQPFNLDEQIIKKLTFDQVGTPENLRQLPSGLDLMAALGSQPATQIINKTELGRSSQYPEQLEKLNQALQALSVAQWSSSAGQAWLSTFKSQLASKGESYPSFMQSQNWSLRDLNAALGGWAELRQTSDISPTIKGAPTSNSSPRSGSPPAYVEPDPEVFFRLASIAQTISQGLVQRQMVGNPGTGVLGLQNLLAGMEDLGTRLNRLGEMAGKELAGIQLQQEDWNAILQPLGPIEGRPATTSDSGDQASSLENIFPSIAGISAISGAGKVLAVGTGFVDRIYVIVPLENRLEIAQGGVFSYYEFDQSTQEELDNQAWRDRLLNAHVAQPEWLGRIILQHGKPVDFLAFRTGDIYRITEAGNNLTVRSNPSVTAQELAKLKSGDYVQISDGPIKNGGYTWWKIGAPEQSSQPVVSGWVIEQPEGYERATDQ